MCTFQFLAKSVLGKLLSQSCQCFLFLKVAKFRLAYNFLEIRALECSSVQQPQPRSEEAQCAVAALHPTS